MTVSSLLLKPVKQDSESSNGRLLAEVFINQTRFIDLITAHEQPLATLESNPSIAGAYSALICDAYTIEHLLHLGMGTHRFALLECTCGEVGCWPLKMSLTKTAKTIQWHQFSQPYREGWSYADFGTFVFERKQYEEAFKSFLKTNLLINHHADA